MIVFKEKRTKFYDEENKEKTKENYCSKLNLICNCKIRCSFEWIKNEFEFNLSFGNIMNKFIGYRLVDKAKYNDFDFYRNTFKHNSLNRLKIMSLCDQDKNLIKYDFSKYFNLIQYLTKLNSSQVNEKFDELFNNYNELIKRPSKILRILNETLFNGEIKNLWLRIGSLKENRITEFCLEESCLNGLHLILKLNRNKIENAELAIKSIITEMIIYYLNSNFDGQFSITNIKELFDKLNDYYTEILIKLKNLIKRFTLNNISKSVNQLIVYHFELRHQAYDEQHLELYYIIPSIRSEIKQFYSTGLSSNYYYLWNMKSI